MNAEPEVIVEVTDGVGRLTLNRPRAINALSLGMIRTLQEALDAWRDDDAVRAVELTGAGERGFCSGADVRAIRLLVLDGADHLAFFREEYVLDAVIAAYPKPVTAWMDGITMGGGLGLSAHASRRVVTPRSRLAMPETIIGFTPDVGVLHPLTRAPGELGTHLALTGTTIGPADALLVGLADECDGQPDPGVLGEARDWIDACYDSDDAEEIVGRLETHPHPDARLAAIDLRARSPLSVAVTLEALRRAASMTSVDEVLAQDLVLARHLAAGPDFVEGVRAQVVDKDRTPRWQHDRIEDVSRAEVLACFSGS